jgi:D-xylose transport system substrate-binding protein
MRRTLGIALGAVLAMGVAACGGSDSSTSSDSASATTPAGAKLQGKIAVLLPDTKSSTRWELADRRFFEAAFKAAGLGSGDYSVKNAQGDAPTQVTQAEQALTEGAKLIVLTNLDPGSGSAIINTAHAKGAKVIDYDRLTVNGKADYYVSGDATQAGRLQGQGLVADLAKGTVAKPAVAILDGAPTDSFATDLKKGYTEVLGPKFASGAYTKVSEQAVPNWDAQQALTIFEQMLQRSGNKIDGVLAANDAIANATVSARRSRQLPFVPTTGLDATAEAIQHILAGEQTMTVYFSIKDQATKAAKLAMELARGQQPTGVDGRITNGGKQVPTILLKPQTIRKDNIASTVIADDYVSWKEICTGSYAKYCPAGR